MSEYLVEIVIDIVDFAWDPDEITSLLGVAPTTVSRKGVKGNKPRAPVHNAWRIYSAPPLNWPEVLISVEAHWKELGNRLSGKEEIFRYISEYAQVELTVIVRECDRYPLVRLPKELIKYAHEANFSRVDVDIYQ
ncbi:DUF4279 domain-containing protein [Aestuariivirga sp.]|uniref:DUF4279 domain-containing protein n=1 Tax=Aestuariivirga sp. TaxID=2650926 RepID=UPI003BAC6E4C